MNECASFEILQSQILDWAKARQIIPNSTPQAQLLKTVEELGELVGAVLRSQPGKTEDGFGDVMVTLIIAAHLAGADPVRCLQYAYDEIKDRKGYLRADGVFVKE